MSNCGCVCVCVRVRVRNRLNRDTHCQRREAPAHPISLNYRVAISELHFWTNCKYTVTSNIGLWTTVLTTWFAILGFSGARSDSIWMSSGAYESLIMIDSCHGSDLSFINYSCHYTVNKNIHAVLKKTSNLYWDHKLIGEPFYRGNKSSEKQRDFLVILHLIWLLFGGHYKWRLMTFGFTFQKTKALSIFNTVNVLDQFQTAYPHVCNWFGKNNSSCAYLWVSYKPGEIPII